VSPYFLNTQETLLRALYLTRAHTHALEKRERERESFIFFFFFFLCEKPFYPERERER
jgi:hypothetical protein